MPQTALARGVNAWFRENARDLPWRREGFGSWGILVSESMLQQTPVARVIPRLEEWLVRWPVPAALAATPASEAVRAWGRLGYPRRALALHACAVAIVERHGGEVPEDVDALLDLPGVGPYTARAVAVFAFGHRHPVVDVNVRRVLARAVDGQGDPGPARTTADLAAMAAQLPEDLVEARVFNAGTMELGAVVCTARSPRCDACPVRDLCAWRAAGYPAYDGPARPTQKRYEGSDRQVRGLLLAELRSSHSPVSAADLATAWSEPVQRERALAGLLADGLAVRQADGTYALPS
ncbi:A/G-specific adenine glycosylase [Clavibacter sp. MX14-G9D]|uniref:A/G-specific adenine glycosylase n=1 Tax=Clavibacter sp. MX14-G9D TaxID=3064656 RepID=UPI00293EB665|nr:A/G-specific adenine glycosylase [Clavibacter sp. MX14-G9D]